MKRKSTQLSKPQLEKELNDLAKMPESEISYEDAPQLSPDKWAKAKVGIFYRPIKAPVTVRLDMDVLAWVKGTAKDGKYQPRINQILRDAMNAAVLESSSNYHQ